jgi:hypothetical protein
VITGTIESSEAPEDAEENNDQGRSRGNDHDETANTVRTSVFHNYVSETRQHTKDFGNTIYILGNPGITIIHRSCCNSTFSPNTLLELLFYLRIYYWSVPT